MKAFITILFLTFFISSKILAGSSSTAMMNVIDNLCMSSDHMALSGDSDKDYLSMMLFHHLAGIQISEAYIKEASDKKLILMAKKIIINHNKEIEKIKEMQQLQSFHSYKLYENLKH